jgi:chorismate mutase
MAVRGVRGATVSKKDDPENILSATRKLLNTILTENPGMVLEDIASVLFTAADDLNSVYPAKAAREMGWNQVPLICAREIPVSGGLSGCIRVLIHWNTNTPQSQIRHVYLGAAASLRPDLSGRL